MRILILTNNQLGLYKFRRELLERLISDHHKVFVSVPEGDFTDELKRIGVRLIYDKYLDRRGTNPLKDIRLYRFYRWLLKKVKPDVVFTYTIKPNIYGGMVCARYKIPYVVNITGLGTSIENNGIIQRISLLLYKHGIRYAQKVFFQNKNNQKYMCSHGIVDRKRIDILPGSGVNIKQHSYEPYPEEPPIVFTTVGRIMKDKGIDEILSAVMTIKRSHPETVFRLIGEFDEEEYNNRVRKMEKTGFIEYLGVKKDVHPYLAESHALIHASYHEGMSNVLLEAASTGRPVIATDVPGCIETFDDGVSGIAFKAGSTEALVNAIESFLAMSKDKWIAMGKAGREKMEREFSREIVVRKYLNEIKNANLEKEH